MAIDQKLKDNIKFRLDDIIVALEDLNIGKAKEEVRNLYDYVTGL